MRKRAWLVCAIGIAAAATIGAQTPTSEYRVVFAAARQLERQLQSIGRDGYACSVVAQPEPGVVAPGVAVVVGLPKGLAGQAADARVIIGGYMGTDLRASLDKAGNEGFRLCGVVLDESATVPALVAVMSRSAGPTEAVRYGVEVLTNYKDSIARLTAAAREGFIPVAASAVNNNRVPDMRSWMVVTERREPATPREIAVRSAPGPDGLERALNEQGKQGYRVDLVWKEATSFVAMMSRPVGDATDTHTFSAESREADSLHFVSGLYLGDFPYLSSGARLVVSDRSQSASTDVEQDPLPRLGALGYADASSLATLGDHISRHHGFAPATVRIRRGPNSAFVLTTVLAQRRQ